MRRAKTRQDGFTLLEVLVAFAIAAMALGVLFQGSLDGLQATRRAGQYQEALSRARSRLAAVDIGGAMTPGIQQGDDSGGFRWTARITSGGTAPLAHGTAADLARGPRVALYLISVTISWRDDGQREVQLNSLRTAILPPALP